MKAIAPRAIIPSFAIAIMQTGAAISLAALVFAGPAAEHLGVGAGTFLLGSALASIVMAYRSTLEVVVAGARNNVAVVVAAVSAGVASSASNHAGSTVATFVVIAAVSSGLLLYLTGRFGFGHLVRFVPFPVMGGYVAGTAWLMVKGGLQVMVGTPVSMDSATDLVDTAMVQLWVPGVLLALAIVLVAGANPQSLIIVGSLVGFHLVVRVVSSAQEFQDEGWFIGPLPTGSGLPLFGPGDLAATDWSAIGTAVPGLGAVALIALTGALLNVSSVEFATGEDTDINHELRACGIASGASGLVGGTVGYTALGPTLLARRLHASSEVVTAAFVCLALVTIVAGPGLIEWMPRFVAGAMIMGPGLTLLKRWWFDSILAGSTRDRVIATVIPLTVAFFGVLEGVGLGILVAAVLFIVRYASIDPVRSAHTGIAARSKVDRPPDQTAILDARGQRIVVLRLEGFLFFGTAARLSERVAQLVDEPSGLEHLVIDFQRVSGADSSARNELTKMARRCAQDGVRLYFSDMDRSLLESLPTSDSVIAVGDADRALEMAETDLLSGHLRSPAAPVRVGVREDVLAYFTHQTVPKGTTLLAVGMAAPALHIVESGSLTVWAQSQSGLKRLRRVGAGAFLGEGSFFGDGPAAATVTADEDCSLYSLTRADFDRMLFEQPRVALSLVRNVLSLTNERLAIANAIVQDLST